MEDVGEKKLEKKCIWERTSVYRVILRMISGEGVVVSDESLNKEKVLH